MNETLDKTKEAAKDQVELARQIAITDYCQQQLEKNTQNATTAIEKGGKQAQASKDDYNELAQATAKAAAGMYAVEHIGKMDAEFVKGLHELNAYFDNLSANIDKVQLGATKSSSKAASSSKDAWVEAFEEEQRLLKHSLEMNEITEYEYYEKLKDLNEKYFGEVSGKHQKYLKEYQENEEEIYKGLKSIYDKVRDYLAKAVENG
jgi:hypothetical protein